MTEARSGPWRTLELIRLAAPYLEGRGVDAPRLDAERMLAHALDWTRMELYTRFEEALPREKVDAFRELIRRRAMREPLQRILGRWEFRSLELLCDGRALTPRPETEEVVEEAVRLLEGVDAPAVADIGCGGGCIALSLAAAIPDARVVGIDISLDSLELALENVEAHGLAGRVRLLEGDLCAPLDAEGLAGEMDMVVSNPPYVRSDEIAALQPEVRDFDPRAALDGGADGLVFYRRLFDEARRALKPGGAMVVELPEDGAGPVRVMAEENGWSDVAARKDFAGIDRVLSARWHLARPPSAASGP